MRLLPSLPELWLKPMIKASTFKLEIVVAPTLPLMVTLLVSPTDHQFFALPSSDTLRITFHSFFSRTALM